LTLTESGVSQPERLEAILTGRLLLFCDIVSPQEAPMIWLAERIAALTLILFNLLRGWWHSQVWLRAALCLLLLGPSSTQAQCDWSKKIAVAIQRRYQTNENACKALLDRPLSSVKLMLR
jgi:hypothetical protein